ncbi:MAG TPA: cadherin-like domain-containing protein, partial [Ferruginibacter sp.]|nr:cadherin-like domain-containing protein [Ferruginibacter sp.]
RGTLVLNADGSYTFTPVINFTGPVDFPYTTTDDGTPQATAMATLHILVRPNAATPDLTPRINSNPNNIIGPSTAEITVQVNEIKNVPTNGTQIVMFVDKLSFFRNFQFDPNRTSNSAGQSVQNNEFTIDTVSSEDFYIIRSNSIFQNSLRRVVFTVTIDPGQTKGSTPINVFLQNGSGGETVYTNNNDFTIITFSF